MVKPFWYQRINQPFVIITFVVGLLLLLLAGCRPQPQRVGAAATETAGPICTEPGRIVRDTLPEPERGYAYPFNVYLPPCYDQETERRYPVLYLLPGLGGSPDSWFAGGVDQTADTLMGSGEIPPFLIVSTESTASDRYGDTIFNEVIPYVDQHYRTETNRHYRAVAGASLGGIGAYRLGFSHPDSFGSVALFGSGIVSGEEEQVREWLAAVPPENKLRVFFNCGEQDNLMLAQAEVLVAILDEAGIPSTLLVSPGEHTLGYWVSNLPAYFRWLAEDW
jgi:enterochelin esterase-like enzyme